MHTRRGLRAGRLQPSDVKGPPPMKGRRWHPVAVDSLLHDIHRRWTPKNPAPLTLVEMWLWHHMDAGRAPSRRALMGWSCISDHHARKAIRRVRSSHNEWIQNLRKSPVHLPEIPNASEGIRGQLLHESPPRGRVLTEHHTDPTLNVGDVDNVVCMASDGQHVTEYRSTEEQTPTIQRQR